MKNNPTAEMQIHLDLPQGWDDFSPEELLYVYTLLSGGSSMESVKSLVMFRIGRWHLADGRSLSLSDVSNIDIHVLADALRHLDWMDSPANPPVRLPAIDGHACTADAYLRQVDFGTYLMLENLWQAYLRQPENLRPITQMNDLLYGTPLDTPLAIYNTTAWFAAIKGVFELTWPDLFKPSPSMGGAEAPDMAEVMNAELRALTGGDVTKEAAVRAVGCWRALEELNAKVKESKQYNK